MKYCTRCLYPENARPTIFLDEEGICSGCRNYERESEFDWEEREKALVEILEEYKSKARQSGQIYDCIIPVSGGKDSHYQVHLAKNVYGLNPLLVTYNHAYNTELGIRNLNNIVKQFNCDLIRVTTSPDSAKRISNYMLRKVGDITWHYHTGIFTFPFQIAVRWKIPLVLWGEVGYAKMTGLYNLEDLPEFTKWMRDEYEMRGIKIEDVIADADSSITEKDLQPLMFPSDEDMENVGVRGIYFGTYLPWDHLSITKQMVKNYQFKLASSERERTFSQFHKLDDHANDVHDYLKYLKFGYGRGTDHASQEIRAGRMTREEGIELASIYDSRRPSSLDFYLDFLGLTEEELEDIIEHQRDESIWEKLSDGRWVVKDSIANHISDPGIENARVSLVKEEDRTFGINNKGYFYKPGNYEVIGVDDNLVTATDKNGFITL